MSQSSLPVPDQVRPAPNRRISREYKKKVVLSELDSIKRTLRKGKLSSVCEEARCPNRSECFGRGTATFLAMGNICTRACGFCSIATGRPNALDPNEPQELVNAAREWNLKHVVVTSVDRDDLPDLGAQHLALIMQELRTQLPATTNEILTPDFQGKVELAQVVLDAEPDVFNHNLETVPSLYQTVRKGAKFDRSMAILRQAVKSKAVVKTGFMLGLGETLNELQEIFTIVADAGIDILTLGQYFQPTSQQLAVVEYHPQSYYDDVAAIAREAGIPHVYAGIYVRSSYNADDILTRVQGRIA